MRIHESPPLQRHGCAVTACCRFFSQNMRLWGMTSHPNIDKLPFSSGSATFPFELLQALAPSWARAQLVYIASRCALLKRLMILILKTSAVDAFAQRKLYGIILRRALCQTASEQFDFAGRCKLSEGVAITTAAARVPEHHSVGIRRNGKRTWQSA